MNEPMASDTQRNRISIGTIVGACQVLSMVVGFCAVLYAMGEKGAQLEQATRDMDKLSQTVKEIASVQAAAAVADAYNRTSIEELRRRLDAVERRLESSHR